MYFASKPCDAPVLCRTLREQIRRHPERHWLALIDGAFDYGTSALPLPNARHALYDCDGMSDLLAASPFLITLTTDDDECLRLELDALVRHRKERPMLSFIGTTAPASDINVHFRRFANAATEDDQTFLLRFADTRVLAGLPAALHDHHWGGMTCPLSDWIVIDRCGELQELSLPAGREALTRPFQLSPAEFAALVSSGEPDAIIDAIAETNPEALDGMDRAVLYERVAETCAFAKRYKVDAFPDLVALAYLGVLNDGKGLHHPGLPQMLMRGQWKTGSLIDELADFVE